MRALFAALVLFGLPAASHATTLDGTNLSLFWSLPFVAILLSIALLPLIAPNLWHHHFGKITALWTAVFLVPFILYFGFTNAAATVTHALLAEYIPFILLLLALYTVSGGILIWGNLNGSAKLNTSILAIGTILASIMGTTGAAMLLIRPLLKANENRQHRVHVVVFFIFLVANIGGSLTPLGDPPLFLGFLKGVDFMWTVKHMALPMLSTSLLLLVLFFAIDYYFFSQKDEIIPAVQKNDPFKIFGKSNFFLLIAIVACVLMSGIWNSGIRFDVMGTPVTLENLLRDALLIVITLVSMAITPKPVRAGNEFNFAPILEVGKLFLGIFITIAPVIAMLKAGEQGHFSSLIALVHDDMNHPINSMYFWMSGILSSILDNAPTYLVFFNMASGDAVELMGPLSQTLLAISMGSVFMGAVTYIGNAPNFMVKAIAEQRKVKMPTFFGYMAWSCTILIPIFILQTLIFF